MPRSPASPHPGRIGPNGGWVPSRFGGTKTVTDRGFGSYPPAINLFTMYTTPSSSFVNTDFDVGGSGGGSLRTADLAMVLRAAGAPMAPSSSFQKGIPYVLVKVQRGAPSSDWLLSSE
jgi:hypothetical protein